VPRRRAQARRTDDAALPMRIFAPDAADASVGVTLMRRCHAGSSLPPQQARIAAAERPRAARRACYFALSVFCQRSMLPRRCRERADSVASASDARYFAPQAQSAAARCDVYARARASAFGVFDFAAMMPLFSFSFIYDLPTPR
jgi:hypothetical protein